MNSKKIEIGYGDVNRVSIGSGLPLAFIGGPCAIESRDLLYTCATKFLESVPSFLFPGYINLVMTRTVDLP